MLVRDAGDGYRAAAAPGMNACEASHAVGEHHAIREQVAFPSGECCCNPPKRSMLREHEADDAVDDCTRVAADEVLQTATQHPGPVRKGNVVHGLLEDWSGGREIGR